MRTHTRHAAQVSVPSFGVLVILAFLLGCQEQPAGPDLTDVDVAFKKGPPNNCNAATDLSITFGDAQGNALQSDGLGAYVEGVDNVGAHLNDPTGRLMLGFNSGDSDRFLKVTTTAGSFDTKDRIYTNNHDNSCAFAGMANGSTGSAVLEAELNTDGIDDGIVRYGKNCDGVADESDPNRVVTTRSADGFSWTITGTSGVHCKNVSGNKGKKGGLVPVGTTGPFSMTLEVI